jgi:uncharacterized protein DUF1566
MRRLGMLRAATCAVSILLVGALLPVTPALAQGFLATGQTTAYKADKNDGIVGPVDIPDDGTLQRGKALRYKVRKDGTVEDKNTGLVWEVKCTGAGCPVLHDVGNTYPWSGNGSEDTIWDWLDQINAEGGKGYAGHADWRIPNVRELQSISDYGMVSPAAIDPIFGPTTASDYWSSSTDASDPSCAWVVPFADGLVNASEENLYLFVRAVRGGPK